METPENTVTFHIFPFYLLFIFGILKMVYYNPYKHWVVSPLFIAEIGIWEMGHLAIGIGKAAPPPRPAAWKFDGCLEKMI